MLGNFLMLFWSPADFFFQNYFSKNSFRNSIRVQYSVDPDQEGYSVNPDLDPQTTKVASSNLLSKFTFPGI